MKQKIIVPVDFSGDSINALEHAIFIANTLDFDIRLIHVKGTHKFEVPEYFQDLSSSHTKSINDIFGYVIEKYGKGFQNKMEFCIREGRVHTEISNQAKYEDAFLIVMGTHGVSGFEEFFIGSNAYKVVTNAPCPVITIRHGFMRKKTERIVLPIDITNESRQKVPFVADYAQKFGAEVHVISVRELQTPSILSKLEAYVDQVVEVLENKKIKTVSQHIQGDNITNMTIDYANKINAELITITTEQTYSPSNIWLGAYAQQMVNHAPVPVMSIRPTF